MITIAILHYLCIRSSQGELEMGWTIIRELMEYSHVNH